MQKAATTPLTNHKKNPQPRLNRNQQYSITALTDGGGTIVERYAYTAYGQVTILDTSLSQLATSAAGNRYTYTGREWDEGLSLYHYRARMYDAVGGRFVSRDPIGFYSGPNLLSYVSSSPVSRVDPSGLSDLYGGNPGEDFTVSMNYFIWSYQYHFGLRPWNYTKGCIGVVQDVVGKIDLADGSTCFSFNDTEKSYQSALEAKKNINCGDCKHPVIFSYRYWSDGKNAGASPTSGVVSNPTIPPAASPNATGIPWDFCVQMAGGYWIGGDQSGGNLVIWPSLKQFDKKYENYDTTVVCVTCTGDEYRHGGFLGLFPHQGPCRDDQLSGLDPNPNSPPFIQCGP